MGRLEKLHDSNLSIAIPRGIRLGSFFLQFLSYAHIHIAFERTKKEEWAWIVTIQSFNELIFQESVNIDVIDMINVIDMIDMIKKRTYFHTRSQGVS